MQGGYPSAYKNPPATYLSGWFIDTFEKYNNDIYETLEMVAASFAIDTKYMREMTTYSTDNERWKDLARKLGLLA